MIFSMGWREADRFAHAHLSAKDARRWGTRICGGLIVVGCLLMVGCRGRGDEPGAVVMIIESSPNNLDLRVGTDAQSERVGGQIFDALVKKDEHYELEPWLATSWEQPDALTWVFHLRDGVRFHDGRPLEAADVVSTIESLIDGSLVTAKGGNFAAVDRAEVRDRLTVVVKMKRPDSGLLFNMSDGLFGVVPRGSGKDFGLHPVGSGPFKFVSQEAGVQASFEAWDQYWRRVPGVKTINVRGIRDLAARMAGLETGELDLAYGMTGKLLQRVMADPKLRWDPNFTAPWHLVFPGYNEPSSPFHDKRVRQAVSLAINRQFLVKQETQGIGKPWGNWISHENRDALRGDGTELPVPPYDPTKAKQLLAEAGFPNGFDFDWYVPFVPYFDMAERILNDLRAVGMRSKLQMLDAPAYMAQTSKGRKGFPGNRTIVQRIDLRPGGAKELIRLYAVCGGPASYICEPKIESLWAKHEASIDVAERDRLSKDIQRAIVEGYYLVPVYLNPFVHAVTQKVLPEGEAVHHYWDTVNAPFPWPWEVWEVKG